MAGKLRVQSISIEGFRGVNKKTLMNFDKKSAILFGPNGVGKTSILQALEWCFFGGLISAIVGPPEFKKEDAIVNSFHPQKRATVEVVLEDEENQRIKVTRERKRGRSSTSGKTILEVEIEGAQHSGEEAQIELNKWLRTTPTEFYASIHLHQEAIRDLLVGDPLVRSEMIDKLLGLHFVRELIEYIPLKYVAKEAKAIEEEIKDIQTRKMQEVAISKKRLAELEIELEKTGIGATSLNVSSLMKLAEDTIVKISDIEQKIEARVKVIEKPQPDTKSLEETLGELKKAIGKLEGVWTTAYKEVVNEASSVKSLKQDYEDALKEIASFEIKDPQEFVDKKSKIDAQISAVRKELDFKISTRSFLQDEVTLVQRLLSNVKGLELDIKKIEQDFGDEAKIGASVNKLQSQIEERRARIKREKALNSILISGLDYLKSTSTNNCPLCRSEIEYAKVIATLQKEIDQREGARLLRQIQKELEELTKEKPKFENALLNFRRLKGELERARSLVDQENEKLKEKGLKPTEDLISYIDSELKETNNKISNLDEQIRQLKAEATEIELRADDLKRKIEKLSSAEKKIQKMFGTTETGEKLVRIVNERISELEGQSMTLDGMTEELKGTKNMLETYEKILTFLKEKDRVDTLEQGMPILQQRLKDLQAKYSKMKELEAGLTDIYQVTSTAREEMVKQALSDLQSTIKLYYSKILSHPYYLNLQLIPEKERGKAIYRIRAWDKDFKQGTYVQTRFSNAQMNVVALSLFLSMATRLPSNLGLILLDDPSQSMDRIHKEALSKLLSQILKEKQVLVATQDIEFEQTMQRLFPKDKALIYNFKEWSLEGPKITQ